MRSRSSGGVMTMTARECTGRNGGSSVNQKEKEGWDFEICIASTLQICNVGKAGVATVIRTQFALCKGPES